MNVWAIWNLMRTIGGHAVVALLAWLAILNSPLWPGRASAAREQAPGEAHGAKAQGEAAHEPNALDHVMDSNEFELFHSFPPHSIHLPNIFGLQITKFM